MLISVSSWAEETEPVAASARSPWRRAEIIALVALILIAGLIRFIDIADPNELVFDEVYYAKDACVYAGFGQEVCEIAEESTYVHPPLGKWLISGGVKIFGYDSFGWRFIPFLAGVISVGLLFAVARKLFRSLVPAVLAAGLLAIDPLHFVQSRTSMLDIFVPMFGLAALLCILRDRDRMLATHDVESASLLSDKKVLARPWRAVAGVLGGLALSAKWSGGLVLLLVIVLTIAWELSARRELGRRKAFMATARRELPSIALYLVLLPVVAYIATYIGRLGGDVFALPWAEGSWGRNLWERHAFMYDFHKHLEARHSYESPPWSWMFIKRPVSYFFCSDTTEVPCSPPVGPSTYQEIFATGSPFVWWASILALVFTGAQWLWRRDMRRAEGVIFAGFCLTYLPWMVIASGRSAVFIFYLLPTIPFMCLALANVAASIGRSWEAKATIAVFAAGAIGMFAFLYPLLVKNDIPEPSWRKRIWIFDNCDKPPGPVVTSTATITNGDQLSTTVSETNDNSSIPPNGWCWI
jgi:dolichyl-phosphate-mannose--protein O-mannosyl transferase